MRKTFITYSITLIMEKQWKIIEIVEDWNLKKI